MSDPTPSTPGTCVYCAEPLPTAVERCPACGESTTPAARDPASQRPLGPKIIALFSLLFGGLGLMGPIATVVMYTVFPADPNDPLRAMADQSPLFQGWIFASQGLGFILSGCLLASGIGLLGWREWGRRLGVQVAIGQLVLLGVSTLITASVFAASLAGVGGMSPAPGPAGMGQMIQGFALGAVLVGACFGAILPLATLIVLRRPANREAFAQAEKERSAA